MSHGSKVAVDNGTRATLMDLLTRQQFRIAVLVAAGQKNSEIAESMGISELMVKNHLIGIYDRSGCWNRLELALRYVYEYEKGLYQRPE